MNWTDIFNGIGNFFQWSFQFIKAFGNAPNVFFWLLIGALTIVWLRMQAKYNKEAEKNNTLK
ncbi:MAG: hypothetical protein WBM13_14610 [Bacteroidia bacterium]